MKTFIIGLDGASFNVLDPLMEEGALPNIKNICSRGSFGPLRTIFPPVTAPAWLAIATGLNPGKTGVFDYINRINEESDAFTPISSAYYNGKAVWDFLGKKDFKVGIFNYPTLAPPPQVNGFVISGMGGQTGNMCYPKELEAEINELTKGYESRLNLRAPKYKRDIGLFFNDINRIIEKQTIVLKHLVKNKDWDFFFSVFSFTDWMGHVLWKDIDEFHPLNDPSKSTEVRKKFRDTWNRIDSIIGELISILPYEANFIIISDHGMGPLESVFYPNVFLENKGWLKRKNLGWKRFLIENLGIFSEGSDNKYYNAFLNYLKERILKLRGTNDIIDFENSLAYSPEHNTMFGCINLTLKGKKTDGFREELIHELNQLPLSIKEILKIQLYLPKDIYSGPYVNLSPDIFFIINDHRTTVEIDFTKRPFVNSPSIKMRSGGHIPEGIFMAMGGAFQKKRIEDISVLDITPTILALYGHKIPNYLDGKVIVDSIKPNILASMKISAGKEGETVYAKENEFEGGDMEDMRKMLKSLGYL